MVGGASRRRFSCYLFVSRVVPAWSFQAATPRTFLLEPARPAVTASSRRLTLPPEVTGPGPSRPEVESWIPSPTDRLPGLSLGLCLQSFPRLSWPGPVCEPLEPPMLAHHVYPKRPSLLLSNVSIRVLCRSCPYRQGCALVCRTIAWPKVPSRMPKLLENIQVCLDKLT